THERDGAPGRAPRLCAARRVRGPLGTRQRPAASGGRHLLPRMSVKRAKPPVETDAGTLPVSIVTISFNQGRYLEECLRSVVAHTSRGAESIFVDPGPTAGSRALMRRYGPRISRVILEPDQGPADGLNKGFAAATGTIFGYINADDRLAPGALAYVQR